MKTNGITPSPRCGHAGILIGDTWYIAGGDTGGLGELFCPTSVYIFISFVWKTALICYCHKGR